MVSNDDFDSKATNLSCFYLHINFEQKYPKPAIVICGLISQGISISSYPQKNVQNHCSFNFQIKVRK